MFKLFNLFTWVTDLVENFTFYGGGGKSGGSSSTAQDFFGKGKRAPYEELLGNLLLGGTIGGTEGYYAGGKGGGKGKEGGTWVPGTPGTSLTDFVKMQPGYQFGMTSGLEALNRNFAATGVGQGGSQSIALQDFGNKYAGQAMQQLITNLMGPSGATMSPGQNSQSWGASPISDILGMGLGMALPKLPFFA